MITTEELMILQLQQQEAERKAVEEYAMSREPERLLQRRIYETIACSAASVIDAQACYPAFKIPGPGWPATPGMGKTCERLSGDTMFHRLVDMQSAGIMREVERYISGTRGRSER